MKNFIRSNKGRKIPTSDNLNTDRKKDVLMTEEEFKQKETEVNTRIEVEKNLLKLDNDKLEDNIETFENVITHNYEQNIEENTTNINGHLSQISDKHYEDTILPNVLEKNDTLHNKNILYYEIFQLERLLKEQIKNELYLKKIKDLDDVNSTPVEMPNISVTSDQDHKRLDPDFATNILSSTIVFSKNVDEVLLARFKDIPVQYRNKDLINSDLGAFIFRTSIIGSDFALSLYMTNTQINENEYGTAISSEGSITKDMRLYINVYKLGDSTYITLKRGANNQNPIVVQAHSSLILGGDLNLSNQLDNNFIKQDGMKLIGTSLIEENEDGLIGAINTDLFDRNHFNQMITKINISDSTLFGDSTLLRVNSVDLDINKFEEEALREKSIDSINDIHNSIFEHQKVLGYEGEKQSFDMDQFVENINDSYYYDKNTKMLYLATNKGLMIYDNNINEWVYKNGDGFFEEQFGKTHRVKFRLLYNKIYILSEKGCFSAPIPTEKSLIPSFTKEELDFYTIGGYDVDGNDIGVSHPTIENRMKNENHYGVLDYECVSREFQQNITLPTKSFDFFDYQENTDTKKFLWNRTFELPNGIHTSMDGLNNTQSVYKNGLFNITCDEDGVLYIKDLKNRFDSYSQIIIDGKCTYRSFTLGFENYEQSIGIVSLLTSNNKIFISSDCLTFRRIVLPIEFSKYEWSSLKYLAKYTVKNLRADNYTDNKEHINGGSWILISKPIDGEVIILSSNDAQQWKKLGSVTTDVDYSITLDESALLKDWREFGLVDTSYSTAPFFYSKDLTLNKSLSFDAEGLPVIVESNGLKTLLNDETLVEILECNVEQYINRENLKISNYTNAIIHFASIKVKDNNDDVYLKSIDVEKGEIRGVYQANEKLIGHKLFVESLSGKFELFYYELIQIRDTNLEGVTSTSYSYRLSQPYNGEKCCFNPLNDNPALENAANAYFANTNNLVDISSKIETDQSINNIVLFIDKNTDDVLYFYSDVVEKNFKTTSIERDILPSLETKKVFSELEVFNIYTHEYVNNTKSFSELEKNFVILKETLFVENEDLTRSKIKSITKLIQRKDVDLITQIKEDSSLLDVVNARYDNNCEDEYEEVPVEERLDFTPNSLCTKSISLIPYVKDNVDDIGIFICKMVKNHVEGHSHQWNNKYKNGTTDVTTTEAPDPFGDAHPLKKAQYLYEMGVTLLTDFRFLNNDLKVGLYDNEDIQNIFKGFEPSHIFDRGFHVNMGKHNPTYNPNEQYIVDTVYGKVWLCKEIDGTTTYQERRILEIDESMERDAITNLVDFPQFRAYMVSDKFNNVFYKKDIMDNYFYRKENDMKNLSNFILVNLCDDENDFKLFAIKTSLNVYYELKESVSIRSDVVSDKALSVINKDGGNDEKELYNVLKSGGLPLNKPCKCNGYVIYNNKMLPIEQVMISDKNEETIVVLLLDRNYKINIDNFTSVLGPTQDVINYHGDHRYHIKTSSFPGIIIGSDSNMYPTMVDVSSQMKGARGSDVYLYHQAINVKHVCFHSISQFNTLDQSDNYSSSHPSYFYHAGDHTNSNSSGLEYHSSNYKQRVIDENKGFIYNLVTTPAVQPRFDKPQNSKNNTVLADNFNHAKIDRIKIEDDGASYEEFRSGIASYLYYAKNSSDNYYNDKIIPVADTEGSMTQGLNFKNTPFLVQEHFSKRSNSIYKRNQNTGHDLLLHDKVGDILYHVKKDMISISYDNAVSWETYVLDISVPGNWYNAPYKTLLLNSNKFGFDNGFDGGCIVEKDNKLILSQRLSAIDMDYLFSISERGDVNYPPSGVFSLLRSFDLNRISHSKKCGNIDKNINLNVIPHDKNLFLKNRKENIKGVYYNEELETTVKEKQHIEAIIPNVENVEEYIVENNICPEMESNELVSWFNENYLDYGFIESSFTNNNYKIIYRGVLREVIDIDDDTKKVISYPIFDIFNIDKNNLTGEFINYSGVYYKDESGQNDILVHEVGYYEYENLVKINDVYVLFKENHNKITFSQDGVYWIESNISEIGLSINTKTTKMMLSECKNMLIFEENNVNYIFIINKRVWLKTESSVNFETLLLDDGVDHYILDKTNKQVLSINGVNDHIITLPFKSLFSDIENVYVIQEDKISFIKTNYIDSNGYRLYYYLKDGVVDYLKVFDRKELYITFNREFSYVIDENLEEYIKYLVPIKDHDIYQEHIFGDSISLIDEIKPSFFDFTNHVQRFSSGNSILRKDAIAKDLYHIRLSTHKLDGWFNEESGLVEDVIAFSQWTSFGGSSGIHSGGTNKFKPEIFVDFFKNKHQLKTSNVYSTFKTHYNRDNTNAILYDDKFNKIYIFEVTDGESTSNTGGLKMNILIVDYINDIMNIESNKSSKVMFDYVSYQFNQYTYTDIISNIVQDEINDSLLITIKPMIHTTRYNSTDRSFNAIYIYDKINNSVLKINNNGFYNNSNDITTGYIFHNNGDSGSRHLNEYYYEDLHLGIAKVDFGLTKKVYGPYNSRFMVWRNNRGFTFELNRNNEGVLEYTLNIKHKIQFGLDSYNDKQSVSNSHLESSSQLINSRMIEMMIPVKGKIFGVSVFPLPTLLELTLNPVTDGYTLEYNGYYRDNSKQQIKTTKPYEKFFSTDSIIKSSFESEGNNYNSNYNSRLSKLNAFDLTVMFDKLTRNQESNIYDFYNTKDEASESSTPYPAQYPDDLGYYSESERPDDPYTYKSYKIKDGLIYSIDYNGTTSLFNLTKTDLYSYYNNNFVWVFGNLFINGDTAQNGVDVRFINGRVFYENNYMTSGGWGGYPPFNEYFNSDRWTNPNGGYLNDGHSEGYHPKHLASHLKIIDGYVCNLDGTKYTGDDIFKKWDV